MRPVELDPETRRVWRDGRELRLSRKEFDLLHALMSRAGQLVTRDELMREVESWIEAEMRRLDPGAYAAEAVRP